VEVLSNSFACFIEGCLRQIPSEDKAVLSSAQGKCSCLRLLKTINFLARI
jgi:hypothetical protein